MNEVGRILAVDFGEVRVGLAITDPDRIVCSPLETYYRQSPEKDAVHFQQLVEEERVLRIVVGLPLHTNDQESVKSGQARAYGAWLAEVTGKPVAFWDERFTTVEAESALWGAGLTHKQRKARRDQLAAQIMLQAYVEAGCPEE